MSSYGLLAELLINGHQGPGDLVRVEDDQVRVDARILGPCWVQAVRIELYMNGTRIRDASIEQSNKPGLRAVSCVT